ncbi:MULTISPECIES: hypothetical protein [Janthinobacterium]|uniref:hypothetical protein n=1 Tax=Janthinobacterium TaxID=29580 RepID=UPI001C5B4AE7|nr:MULTISPECIES: hypothetical protein [Janthinobacterium]MBW3511064.1 hypothetical protein [Janthinobacterium sp. NKUCC06_STL]MCA1863078.1 hypothetical protein [Janthinobacterium lividum]
MKRWQGRRQGVAVRRHGRDKWQGKDKAKDGKKGKAKHGKKKVKQSMAAGHGSREKARQGKARHDVSLVEA